MKMNYRKGICPNCKKHIREFGGRHFIVDGKYKDIDGYMWPEFCSDECIEEFKKKREKLVRREIEYASPGDLSKIRYDLKYYKALEDRFYNLQYGWYTVDGIDMNKSLYNPDYNERKHSLYNALKSIIEGLEDLEKHIISEEFIELNKRNVQKVMWDCRNIKEKEEDYKSYKVKR